MTAAHALCPTCPIRPAARPRHLRLVAPPPSPPRAVDPRTAAEVHRLLTAVVEVVAGRRAESQLPRLLTPAAVTAVRCLPRFPGLTGIKSLHTCLTAWACVEAAAVVHGRGGRVVALAARVEEREVLRPENRPNTNRPDETGAPETAWHITAVHLLRSGRRALLS